MTISEAKEKLAAYQRKMAAYGQAMALISYDGSTGAPKGTAANRGVALSVLSEECYKIETSEETLSLLKFLDENKSELDEITNRMVERLYKSVKNTAKIPMDEYIEYQELMVESDDVWHRAKETNDWAMFEPVLTKVFEYTKRFAGYIEPDKDPYDYQLGEYEEGLTKEKCDEFFASLRNRIVPLIKKISAAEQVDDSCLKGLFTDEAQYKFGVKLMELIGVDMNHCALATTEHPFTTSIGSHYDVRITTNYDRDNFSGSMYSVIHEGGHAMYELGISDEYAYTTLDTGTSMSIHESQSRFYENIIGRSREFCALVMPIINEYFPNQIKSVDELYKALNKVQPSLIRTDADEVTYCLHVMIRFELEKKIFAGEIEVKDLPSEWNRLYKEYLGVDVPDDKRGVLQDCHWGTGLIGYFPSYALGSAYGAQFMKKMRETVDVDKCIAEGNFKPVNDWNREHIWRHGAMLTPKQILDTTLGEEFDPNVYCDYLEKKYREIYKL